MNIYIYRGKVALSDEEVKKMYNGFTVSYDKIDPLYNRNSEVCYYLFAIIEYFEISFQDELYLRQLMDLFTLPWVGLLTTATEYFDTNGIVFDSQSLFQDVEVCHIGS